MAQSPTQRECPGPSGALQDPFGRLIDYLRISVTDRCNLRCEYCMPAAGVQLVRHEDVLSYEEIAAFVRTAVRLGVTKVRLTGGEPLARRGVVSLVRMLSGIRGIHDLAMSSNGVLLPRFAEELKAAGLQRVNISLDAVAPERYAAITRGGDVESVFRGIAAAREAGLTPIKLNCVVSSSTQETDAQQVAAFARQNGLEVRFIRRMSLETGEFSVVEGGHGGDCPRCNRLRLSSDGWLRPCLFSDVKVNIRGLTAEEAIRRALDLKPEAGTASRRNRMYHVGG